MNVIRENQADQTALLKITVSESDYAEKVEKALKNYRKKANVPGFRPGMVPQGLINKMYRKSALSEEAYRTASDAAFAYIKDNNIDPIGDLMPADEQQPLDFETQTEFEFVFKIGLAPRVELNLSKEDKVEKFVVTPSEDMVAGYRENFLKRYGKLEEVDVVTREEAVSVTLSNDEMTIEDAYIGLISMDEAERAVFIGKKVGDQMEVNINELYKKPEQRAAILSVQQEELEALNPMFNIEITKIRTFVNPALNEDFFALAFPDGSVKSEANFEAVIVSQVQAELASQTDFKIVDQIRTFALDKANLTLPEEFLKTWLFQLNEGKFTMEDIEKEFPAFLNMMKWDLVKREVARESDLEVTEDDAKAEAKAMALMQFRYYGMNQVADDMLENYSTQILSNKEEAKKIYEKVGERKVVDSIASQITLVDRNVSIEEFSAMMQQQ